MASAVILTAIALLVPITLVLAVPISTNSVDTLSPKPGVKLPLDVNVIYVKEGEYQLVVRALRDVTDVTTTVSLNKVVTEVTDGVEVVKLTKEAEGNVWVSPHIKVKLSNKDVLHLGVHFVQEGAKELQTVNYFEMKIFDSANKLEMIKDGKIIKEGTKRLTKRSARDSSNNEENGGMILYATDEDGNMDELSERWGPHGGYHEHDIIDHYHGNGDFIQIPFVPSVKIPSIHSPVDSAFGLFSGFLGEGNQERDNVGGDRHRPYHLRNHDRIMGGSHGRIAGVNGDRNDWRDWHGHRNGHNHGNNGRWPDRHRPHNNNCHHHGSDDSDEDDSNEKPHRRRPGPSTTSPWTSPTTLSTTRYTTRKTTIPTRTTTTTTEYPDIDIRFGEEVPNGDPKPDVGLDLPAAV